MKKHKEKGSDATYKNSGAPVAPSDDTMKKYSYPWPDDRVSLQVCADEFDASIHTYKDWHRKEMLETSDGGRGKPLTASRLEVAAKTVERKIGSNLDANKLAAMYAEHEVNVKTEAPSVSVLRVSSSDTNSSAPSDKRDEKQESDTSCSPPITGNKDSVSTTPENADKKRPRSRKNSSSRSRLPKSKRAQKAKPRYSWPLQPPRNRSERRHLVALTKEGWSLIPLEGRIKLFREFHADIHSQTNIYSQANIPR